MLLQARLNFHNPFKGAIRFAADSFKEVFLLQFLFVCSLVGLEINGPVKDIKVMSSRSAYLTHFS